MAAGKSIYLISKILSDIPGVSEQREGEEFAYTYA
jgi:hypothetical protein